MISYLFFIISVGAIFLISFRRYKLTKKDIALQEKMIVEEKIEQANLKKERRNPFNAQIKTFFNNHVFKKSNRETILSLYKQAETLIARGIEEEAVKTLMQIISMDDKHIDSYKKLGLIYLKKEENLKAEFIFKKLLKLRQDASAFSNLGLALFNQGKLKEATKNYEKAIELDKSRVARFVSLGHVYHELRLFEKALENFEHAHKMEPENVEYLFILSDYYEKKHNFKKTTDFLEKLLKIDPYNQEAVARLAEIRSRELRV